MKKIFLFALISIVMIVIGVVSTVYYIDYKKERGEEIPELFYKQMTEQQEVVKEETKSDYESTIPIEYVQSPFYVHKFSTGMVEIYRNEDSHYELARIGRSDINSFIADINSVLAGNGDKKYNSHAIRKTSTGIDMIFTFGGEQGSFPLTNRQVERFIYDLKQPLK